MLHILNHFQKATPMKTDNATASSFSNDSLIAKRSKAWDMRYYWIKDYVKAKDYSIYWDPGTNNWASYFTKHHQLSYHQQIRSSYIFKGHHLTRPSMSARVFS